MANAFSSELFKFRACGRPVQRPAGRHKRRWIGAAGVDPPFQGGKRPKLRELFAPALSRKLGCFTLQASESRNGIFHHQAYLHDEGTVRCLMRSLSRKDFTMADTFDPTPGEEHAQELKQSTREEKDGGSEKGSNDSHSRSDLVSSTLAPRATPDA